MSEETKMAIKSAAVGTAIVAGYVAMAYGSYKLLALMTGKVVAAELLKKGAVLMVTAAV